MSSDSGGGPAPVFIVSTGRAGSQMLARVLARVPSVFALHEPRPHLVTEGYLKWAGRLSPDAVEAAILKKRSDLIHQVEENGLGYVESSHYCSHFIPELDRIFDARFIFLHRDPRGFTKSGLSRDWYEERPLRARLRTLIRRRWIVETRGIWEDHRLQPPPGFKTRMERIAWLWSEINRTILAGLSQIDASRTLEVRLECIGPETFRKILTFIEAPFDDAAIDRMVEVAARKPNKTKKRPDELGPWNEEAFERITAEMATRLGYRDP